MKLLHRFVLVALGLVTVVFAVVLGLWTKETRLPTVVARRFSGLQCGHWAACRACEVMGIQVTNKQLQEKMIAGPEGHSLLDIAEFLEQTGLLTRGVSETFESFLAKDGTRIVHMTNPDHFIVVTQANLKKVFYLDQEGRRQVMSSRQFASRWSGHVLYVDRPKGDQLLGLGPPLEPGHPRVQFETLFQDKGDMLTSADTASVTFEYSFRNLGSAPLTVKSIRTNCSCLKTEKPERPVPPGGFGIVKLHYHLDKNKQAFLQDAAVELDDPISRFVILRAAGNTNIRVNVSHPSLLFGDIPVGTTGRSSFFLRYNGEEEFAVNNARSNLANVILNVRDTMPAETARLVWPTSGHRPALESNIRVIEAEYSAELVGDFQGEIVANTNIKRFEKITVPFRGRVIPPVTASPTLLSFGESSPNDALEKSIYLSSAIKKPFKVLAVLPEIPGMRWFVSPSAFDETEVRLHFETTGAVAHSLSGKKIRLRIRSVEKTFELSIPIYAAHPILR